MNIGDLSPDDVVLWQWGVVRLNYTIVYTWLVMVVLVAAAAMVSGRLIRQPAQMTRWQSFLEVVVTAINGQIRDITQQEPRRYLPFIGTLFLFIITSNLLAVVPGFYAPTASLSTTTALALCVLVAVPFYGIAKQGVGGYLQLYIKPTPFMLPFNLIGELSRTLALSVRLFGNMMSGAKIAAILLAIAPLLFPVLVHAIGLLTGIIQAYIFAILALVYIASATQAHQQKPVEQPP